MPIDNSQKNIPEISPENNQSRGVMFSVTFYCGIFAGCTIVAVGIWLLLEENPCSFGGIGRLLGTAVFGTLLFTGIFGTLLEMTMQKLILRFKTTIRSSRGLFLSGILVSCVSLPLITGFLYLLAVIIGPLSSISFRMKFMIFGVTGFASAVLSTAFIIYGIVAVHSLWPHENETKFHRENKR